MKTVFDISNLKNTKVLLRVDFDLPVRSFSDRVPPLALAMAQGGRALEIEETFRIEKQKPMIDYLVERGAKIVMVAHISAVSSFTGLIPQLHMLLGREIGFIKQIDDITDYLESYPGPSLLENIRRFPGEKENDRGLALSLSKGFDIYVNNNFAVCHRRHASVSAVTEFLPSYAGLLVQKEVAQLQKAINAPKAGKVIIIGGAKTETKVPVIKNFINKADFILTGGVVANDILKEKGHDVGDSVVDKNSKELLAGIDLNSSQLLIPEDFVIFDNKILDIGEKTIKKYADIIASASVVIWNGPMGLFENPAFAMGTNEITKAIANSSAYKVIGGGDTITAISKCRNIEMSKFDFISTGGGAMLMFLAGQRLPGLEMLGYYE